MTDIPLRPELFRPDAIAADTAQLNAGLVATDDPVCRTGGMSVLKSRGMRLCKGAGHFRRPSGRRARGSRRSLDGTATKSRCES